MEVKKTYQSNRLKGIQGGWSDIEFLEYVKSRVDWRTKKPEIVEASDERFDQIIAKIRKIEASNGILALLDSIKDSDDPKAALLAILGGSK